jgi:ATP-dependent phosphofructokinase / diphosphate-dependent phosphofructokinase
MRMGILTGGGDCPGLNAVIRAVVRHGMKEHNSEVVGFLEGWRGPLQNMVMPLTLKSTDGLIQRGGTILRTSRIDPFELDRGPELIVESMKKNNLNGLIVVGGKETCSIALRMFKEHNLNVVCIPKTIDNDLSATDFTFGFDTAVNIVSDALDRLHTTAESHNRVLVCEVMGKHAGWIACYGGIAGGADFILVPEKAIGLHDITEAIKKRHARGKDHSIIVVAEGARLEGDAALEDSNDPTQRQVGIGDRLAKLIESETGFETRAIVLGHIQRGGSPSAYDRVLATRFGVAAVDLVTEKKFGTMVALQNNRIVDVPLGEATDSMKTLDMELYKVASVFFG